MYQMTSEESHWPASEPSRANTNAEEEDGSALAESAALAAAALMGSASAREPGKAIRATSSVFSMAGSLLIHGSLLAALLIWRSDPPGAVQQPSEAISISFQMTEVLEAIQATEASATASVSSVSESSGVPETVTAQAEPESTEMAVQAEEYVTREAETVPPKDLEAGDVKPPNEMSSKDAELATTVGTATQLAETHEELSSTPKAELEQFKTANNSSDLDLDVVKGNANPEAASRPTPTQTATDDQEATIEKPRVLPPWQRAKKARLARLSARRDAKMAAIQSKMEAEAAERAKAEKAVSEFREKQARTQPPKNGTNKSMLKKQRDGAAPGKAAASSRNSRGAKGSEGGKVSASRGSAVNYAATVRARVASRRPSGAGRRGTVVVSFGVTTSGGLAYASVSRSSGNAGLDQSVLSAVRSAGPFPPPPPGAGRQFSIPFHFR